MLLLSGTGGCLLAQSGEFILSGKVVDAETQKPVPFAGVQLGNTVFRTTTGPDGTFSLKPGSVAANEVLIVSHIGYQQETVKLKPGQTNYILTLKPKNNTLSEVKITASKKLEPRKISPETVVDYTLINKRLFVLYWEKDQKNPSLKVLYALTDSLLLTCRLPVYATSLFVDCLDNLHLLTETAARQVYSDSVSLRLYPPAPRSEFERYLRPCLAEAGDNVYFRREQNKGIIASFLAVNQKTEAVKLLRTIRDEDVLAMQRGEASFQGRRSGGGDPEMNMNRTPHTLENNIAFAQQFLFVPPYIPLLKVGKNICLFNHLQGNVEFYERDSLTTTLPVDYHRQPGWAKQLITDKVTASVYALFQRNGLYELKELDLNTGKLGAAYKIPHEFASGISVHNHTVYFLYKNPAKNLRQFLYKAPLKQLAQ